MNKRLMFLAAAAAALVSVTGVAHARDVNWSISIDAPVVGAVISQGPRGYPVHGYGRYHAPPVVVVPPPRVVYSQPYVYAPRHWEPAYYYGRPAYRDDRWGHRHGRHDRYRDGDRWHGDDRGRRDDDRWTPRDERRFRH